MVRALLIDGHSVMLPTFQAGLFGLDERVVLVSVGSLRMARRMLRDEPPFDFVLLDLQPAGGCGFETLAEICSLGQGAPILACSTSLSTADIIRIIYLGASAFVPRIAGAAGLLEALRSVAEGRIYLPPLPLGRPAASAAAVPVARAFGTASHLPAGGIDPWLRPSAWPASLGLTRRQGEVLTLLLEGEPNKAIARRLNLSVETVKDHVTRLLRTLNVRSRTQAVLAVRGLAAAGAPAARPASMVS